MFQIPRWLHITFGFVLIGIAGVTTMVTKQEIAVPTDIMSLLSLAALLVHSVDPEAK
jgi:hypothetical protein